MYGKPQEDDSRGRQSADVLDRRKEPRYPTGGFVEVNQIGVIAPPFLASVVDVSKSGMRLRMAAAIERGVRLRVRLEDLIAFGEVRWTRQIDEETFEAGLAVDHTVRAELVSNIRRAAGPTGESERKPDERD